LARAVATTKKGDSLTRGGIDEMADALVGEALDAARISVRCP